MKKSKSFCLVSVILLLASCSNASSSTTTPASSSSPATASSETTVSSKEVDSSVTSSEEKPSSIAYDPYAVSSLTERVVPMTSVVFDNETNELAYKFMQTVQIYTINNSSIPYVSLDYFTNVFIGSSLYEDEEPYQVEKNDGVAVVKNPTNGTSLTIDFVNRTAQYIGFLDFDCLNTGFLGHFVGSVYGCDILNPNMITYDMEYGNEAVTLDLSAYDLDLFISNGKYLLPFGLASALLPGYSYSLTYFNDAFYYHNNEANDATAQFMQDLRDKGTEWIDDEYLEFNYNMLAFGLDLCYGLDERQWRTQDKTTTYLEQGAYAMLAPYKDRLLSTDPDVSNDAICELFANELEDGGHDKYVSSNIFGTKTFTRMDVCGPETLNTMNTMNAVQAARKEKGIDYTTLAGAQMDDDGATITPNGCYVEDNGIAYIQFDEFTKRSDNYLSMEVTDTNYGYDTMTLFHYANEKIQNNPDIKDVIIDLSANGGGVMYSSEFISSWVCGGNTGVIRNALTGTTMKYHISADVNFDGVFDSRDYLSSDINVYVMISNSSFSCGNKLPCNIKDNRLENTYFIGSRTGGGSCAISYLPMNFMGGELRISSNLQLGRSDATKDNFHTVESGVEADFDIFDNADTEKFVDLDSIKAKVIANRNHD